MLKLIHHDSAQMKFASFKGGLRVLSTAGRRFCSSTNLDTGSVTGSVTGSGRGSPPWKTGTAGDVADVANVDVGSAGRRGGSSCTRYRPLSRLKAMTSPRLPS